jgi:UDP-glucose 4-epimerase
VAARRRVLITGATGHLGGRLFRSLVAHESVLARALVRTPQVLPAWAQNSELCVGDLVDPRVRASVLQDVDCVVHLATRGYSATISPTREELSKEEALALALVNDAIKARVSRFIYVSSVHVYGDSLVGEVDESSKTAPNTPYGHSRKEIEATLLDQADSTCTDTIVVRLTNSFGTPAIRRDETWNLLMHDLCRQVVSSGSITLRSDGQMLRDTMAMRDVEDVLTQLILTSTTMQGTYLLASGRTSKLSELAELVRQHAREILGINAQIVMPMNSMSSPVSFVLNPSKLRKAGISISDHRDDEVRDLLLYARQTFGEVPA